MLKSALRHVRDTVNGYRSVGASAGGVPLPPGSFRMGGRHFEDDASFVESAVREVQRLEHHGMRRTSRVLDWGCGAGRLAVGLQEHWGRIGDYHGVDIQRPLIQWAKRHLAHGPYTFTHLDAANDRYNPGGEARHEIPGEDAAYDVVYAYSVFSHMVGSDVRTYMTEVRRLLRSDGFAFFTAFVEDDVEPETHNPEGYGPMTWSSPLHCVRYDRDHFQGFLDAVGLRTDHFEHGSETDGQSLFVVRPVDS